MMGKKFLQEIDDFLANNCRTLKCSDIHNIYSQFCLALKDFKGNAHGFTGLSEYLIFRFFYHLLGGSFKPVQITKERREFKSDKGFRIGQNALVKAGGKRQYPDIVVYQNSELKAIVQVKIYITGGLKEIQREIATLKNLKCNHAALRALMIIFNELPKKGKCITKLTEERNQNSKWLNFLVLEKNNDVLSNELEGFLGI